MKRHHGHQLKCEQSIFQRKEDAELKGREEECGTGADLACSQVLSGAFFTFTASQHNAPLSDSTAPRAEIMTKNPQKKRNLLRAIFCLTHLTQTWRIRDKTNVDFSKSHCVEFSPSLFPARQGRRRKKNGTEKFCLYKCQIRFEN